MDAELDRQGRLLVPPLLRQHAGLSGTVFMIGRDECLEIWSPDRWEAEHALADEAYETALESLEERA